MIRSFADLIAPMALDTFFADHFDRAPVHIPGEPDKVGDLMSWADLNRIMSFEDYWTCDTLKLFDRYVELPQSSYAKKTDGDMPARRHPDPSKVAAHLARGAGLVLHTSPGITPDVHAIALAIEHELLADVRPQIYCSFADQQLLPSHFDTYDIFVVQTAGEKTWQLFQGRLDAPTPHPAFLDQSTAFHLRARADVLSTVTLRPGDMLYVPRGQYHDARAGREGSIHMTFAVHGLRGLDLFELFQKESVAHRIFRQDLPLHTRPGGRDLLAARLDALGDQFKAMASDPQILEAVVEKQKRNGASRQIFDLPRREKPRHFRLLIRGLRVSRHGDVYKLEDDRQGTVIPFDANELVTWVLNRPVFTNVEARAECPTLIQTRVDEILDQLAAMRVIEESKPKAPKPI